MTGLAFLVFHAGVMPVLLGLALARLLSCRREDVPAVIFYTLGLWIGLTTLLTDFALRWAPGLPRSAYLAAYAVLAIFVAVAALRRRLPQDDWTLFSPSGPVDHVWRAAGRLDAFSQALLAVLIVICAAGIVTSFVLPLVHNDPITHTVIGQLLARDRSAALYPFAEADPQTGYLIEAVHPLGFAASKTLIMILLGDLDTPWHKPLSAIFLTYVAIGTGTLAARVFSHRAGVYAFGFIVLTPLFHHSAVIAHIDPLRVWSVLVCFAALAEYVRSPTRCWMILGSLGLTICLHVHAGNIIVLPLLACLFLLFAPGPFLNRIGTGVLIAAPAMLLASPQYLKNLALNGSLAGTSYALERESPEKFLAWYELGRDISSTSEAIFVGALAPFTDLTWFGFVFWFGLAGFLLLLATKKATDGASSIIAGVLVLYAGLVAVAVAMGRIEFYMNSRYMLIVLPFAAILAGYAIDSLRGYALRAYGRNDDQLTLDASLSAVSPPAVRPLIAAGGVAVLLSAVAPLLSAVYGIEALASRTFEAFCAVATSGCAAGKRDLRHVFQVLLLLAAGIALWKYRREIARTQAMLTIREALARAGLRPGRMLVEASVITFLAVGLMGGLQPAVGRSIEKLFNSPFLSSRIVFDSDIEKAAAQLGNEAKKSTAGLMDTAFEVRQLRSQAPQDLGRTLALRDSEIYYYGSGYTYSVYDRRIWPAFAAASTRDAHATLKSLGIGLIYVPNYSVPGAEQNSLESLIHDPTYRSIEFEGRDGYSLLRLLDKPRPVQLQSLVETRFPAEDTPASTEVLEAAGACDDSGKAVENTSGKIWKAPDATYSCTGNKLNTWLSLPPPEPGDELLVEVGTAAKGCIQLVVYQRLPSLSTSRKLRYDSRTFRQLALTDNDRFHFGVKRLAESDALALQVVSGCNRAAGLSNLRVSYVRSVTR